MKQKTFDIILKTMHEQEKELMSTKGKEYAPEDNDKLSNFKLIANMTGGKPIDVCFTYMAKHFLSIASYIKNGQVKSNESIFDRIVDLKNYLTLIYAIIEEDNCEKINRG